MMLGLILAIDTLIIRDEIGDTQVGGNEYGCWNEER